MEGYQWGGEVERGAKVQGRRSIIGRQKIGRLRTAMEKEKPMNLCLKPMDMN